MLSVFKQDLRYGVRQLRKNPGFTASAVLTLALGIGANVTVFLILYGVLLRPLPFPQPQELVRIERLYPDGELSTAYSATKVLFMPRASRTLESTAGYDYVPNHMNLVQGGEAIPLQGLGVTKDFFHVFQMEPEMGRGFNAQDTTPNAPGVAVISDATWRQQFAADPNILGQAITLGNKRFTVIGVANPKFRLDAKVDVWTPLCLVENAEDHNNMYHFVARLKPGVTREQAQDDLKRVLLQLKETYPALWSKDESVRVLDYHDSLVGDVRPALEILMGAVGLVLVIVVANILSLLLTRSIARRREMSLRAALGASSWRILRQLLVENTILCIAGGSAGLLFAVFAVPALLRLSPLELPHFAAFGASGATVLFAAALTIACALLFSFVPALESRRSQLNDSLRLNPTQVASSRNLSQRLLVVGEVATSLVLLVAAALLLTSFWKLIHVSPGFTTERVLTFKTSLTDEQAATTASMARHLDALLGRMEAEPGVESAAGVLSLPTQVTPDLPFDIVGRPKGDREATGDEKYVPVTAHFFETLQIPIITGRSFTAGDVQGATPVVIVNQQFARTYFKGQNPVGQYILIGVGMGPELADSVRQIVGVVGDTKSSGLDMPAPGMMYLPAEQIPDTMTRMDARMLGISWVMRTKSSQLGVVDGMRRIFLEHNHTPLLSVTSMQDVISASVAQQRFNMMLLCIFGMISLILGAAGLYGVMSYTVARQTKEIGVRMAIGAQRGDILQMVLREAGRLVVYGLLLGVVAALAGAHLLRSLLFGIAPRDPFAIAAMCGLLLLTGLFAAWWPARRAAATEPMQALRSE